MTDKKQEQIKHAEYDEVTEDEYTDAIISVLFQPLSKANKAKYENRKPSLGELSQRWKLQKG